MHRLLWCFAVVLTVACSSKPHQRADARPRGPGKIPTVEELSAKAPPERCRLDLWEDGDTPYVTCADGKRVGVRMLGIDTAESGFDENSTRRSRYQADLWGLSTEQIMICGKAATARVKELCAEGSEVEVVGNSPDKYGRRLAYVICAGVNLNARLVEEGHAGLYPYPGPPEKPSGCPRAGSAAP